MDILNSIYEGDLQITGNLLVSGNISGTITPFQNIKIVKSTGDLPTASGGKHTLLANTLYWIDAAVINIGTNYLEMSNGTALRANSSLSSTMIYSGTGAAIRGTDVNATISFISISAGKAFDFSNTARNKYLSIQQVGIANQTSQSTVTGYNVFITFIINYVNCAGGFSLTNNGKLVARYHNWDSTNTGTFFTLNPNTYTETNFTGLDINVSTGAGNKGIDVTSTNILNGIISDCVFDGTAPVSQRLVGVNGNTPGWNIQSGSNSGIAGIKYVDIEITASDSTLGNSAATYIDSAKGLVLSLANYDAHATVMEIKVSALFTSTAIPIQVGVRNNTTGTNLGGLSASTTGTNVVIESAFVSITPEQEYTGYYIKPSNGSGVTRKGLKLTLKIY